MTEINQVHQKSERFEIDGESPQMRQIREQLLSLKDEAVNNLLIVGPRGTGKERIGRRINVLHQSNRPFIYVNCANLPKGVLTGFFFGYASNSIPYKSTKTTKMGLVEMAENGDLYLDNIGELPLKYQKKFLRFFTDREYSKSGDHTVHVSNVRVIAATHEDLQAKCKHKLFLKELYFTLASHLIKVPPLSERRSDIPLLISSLLSLQFPKGVTLTNELLTHFQSLEWSENIDELQKILMDTYLNAKQRESTEMDLEDLSNKRLSTDFCHLLPNTAQEVTKTHLNKFMEASEKLYWIQVLTIFQGNASRIARETRIPLSTINYKLKYFKLRKHLDREIKALGTKS